jgi:FkbM family methyltransferase
MISELIKKSYRVAFARPWAVKINRFLLDCALRGLGVLNYENMKVSGERYLFDVILSKRLTRKSVIFDVGANSGQYSGHLRSAFPFAGIHAFEPNPSAYAKIPVALLNCITINKIGLSDLPGSFDLYDRGGDAGSEHASLYRGVLDTLHKVDSIPVRVELDTIDNYCRSRDIAGIDFLKIDTEGHELQVLKGASELIKYGKIGIVQIEFNEMNVVSRTFCRDFLEILPNHKFYRLLPSGLIEIPKSPLYSEVFAFQNLVAIPME